MVNALFYKGREKFLTGDIDFEDAEIRVGLVEGYTGNIATHGTVADLLTAGGVIVMSAVVSPKTVTDGIADAGDVTFENVPEGDPITAIVIYQATTASGGALADSAKPLIAYFDTSTGATLPITPNGGNITVQWDNGPNKIFAL